MTSSVNETCTVCQQTDDHPKFHLIGPSDTGLGWNSMHHDCAASQGHEHARLIVQATNGAKGDELRYLLTDAEHEVHALVKKAVEDFHEKTVAEQRAAEENN